MTLAEVETVGAEYYGVAAGELTIERGELGWSISLLATDERTAAIVEQAWHTTLFVAEPSGVVHMIPEYPPLGG